MNVVAVINKWRGKKPLDFAVSTVEPLQRNWIFTRSWPSAGVNLIRIRSLTGLRLRPRSSELKPVTKAAKWTCYFIYSPDGLLSDAHMFTLRQLRALNRPLLVVIAARHVSEVSPGLADLCDALWWKGLPGYDFSAYRIGLEAIADKSAGADVFVINDSVFGPFTDLNPILDDAPWDLTGFTAFSLIENHIQSYAFQLKNVTPARVRTLAGVMRRHLAFDTYRAVVYLQESRFARLASRQMSVGALWYADAPVCGDPTVYAGLDLLSHGFPFMKKSLFGRNRHLYDVALLQQALQDRGHPPFPVSSES